MIRIGQSANKKMADIYWDNDEMGEESDFGIPIVPVFPFPELMDYEMLLMPLSSDHAKIVLIRHFGLRGKKAAKAAGFTSEWSLYRREHELKKILERKREHFLR